MLVRLHERPLESLVCPNAACRSNHGDRQKGLKIRYWRGGRTIRYLRCHDCGTEFSERKGTPLFDLRIPEEKAFDILHHLSECCGIRRTSRLCHVREETVLRLQRRCGEHFKLWHDKYVRGVPVHEAQLDEKWSFVKKNRRTATPTSLLTRNVEINGTMWPWLQKAESSYP